MSSDEPRALAEPSNRCRGGSGTDIRSDVSDNRGRYSRRHNNCVSLAINILIIFAVVIALLISYNAATLSTSVASVFATHASPVTRAGANALMQTRKSENRAKTLVARLNGIT